MPVTCLGVFYILPAVKAITDNAASQSAAIVAELRAGKINLEQAKQCALIAVDEIINSSPLEPNFADWDDCGGKHRYFYDAQKTHAFHFWQEVKKEIEKL